MAEREQIRKPATERETDSTEEPAASERGEELKADGHTAFREADRDRDRRHPARDAAAFDLSLIVGAANQQ